jgi:ribosomal protein S18 acetylase RimI-like enzyme
MWNRTAVDITRITLEEIDLVREAAALFDGAPDDAATRRFLTEPGHHLLMACVDERPVGMVTGVETTHPDKGTEMFLYELSVHEDHRGKGIGKALVTALAHLARERGCYGMWVGTDDDNEAALATYESTGGVRDEAATRVLTWDLRS